MFWDTVLILRVSIYLFTSKGIPFISFSMIKSKIYCYCCPILSLEDGFASNYFSIPNQSMHNFNDRDNTNTIR